MTKLVVVTRDSDGKVRATYKATAQHPLRGEDTKEMPVPTISQEDTFDHIVYPPEAVVHQLSGEFKAKVVGVLNASPLERMIAVELHPHDTERWEAIHELMSFSYVT